MLAGIFSKKEKKTIEWHSLTDSVTLDEIDQISNDRPVLIFKHSTRCAISSMVLNRLENSLEEESDFEIYFLDLISYRDVSNEVATRYGVQHQSPQAILVSKGKVIYDDSHTGIVYDEIAKRVNEID